MDRSRQSASFLAFSPASCSGVAAFAQEARQQSSCLAIWPESFPAVVHAGFTPVQSKPKAR